jgi:hypothetical protein
MLQQCTSQIMIVITDKSHTWFWVCLYMYPSLDSRREKSWPPFLHILVCRITLTFYSQIFESRGIYTHARAGSVYAQTKECVTVVSSSDVWWQGAACFIYCVLSFSSSNVYSVGITENCFDTMLLVYCDRVTLFSQVCQHDTPLSTKVGTKFRRQVAVAQSV